METLKFCLRQNVSNLNGGGQSTFAYHTIGEGPLCMCQPDMHSQKIAQLFNNHFSSYISQGITETIVLRLMYFYEFINRSHKLTLSILDKLHVIS